MARVPQVTRTIITTVCHVTCYNIETKQVESRIIKLPRTYRDEKAMMKKIPSAINDPSIKAVHVDDFSVEETLYGMSEEKFIANAEILPKRT